MRRWENSLEIFFFLFVFHLQRQSFHLAVAKMSWSGFEIGAERFGMLEIHFHYKSNHQQSLRIFSLHVIGGKLISTHFLIDSRRKRREIGEQNCKIC